MNRIMANRTDVRLTEMTGEHREREGGAYFAFVRGVVARKAKRTILDKGTEEAAHKVQLLFLG